MLNKCCTLSFVRINFPALNGKTLANVILKSADVRAHYMSKLNGEKH